jgi:hypothetical protein
MIPLVFWKTLISFQGIPFSLRSLALSTSAQRCGFFRSHAEEKFFNSRNTLAEITLCRILSATEEEETWEMFRLMKKRRKITVWFWVLDDQMPFLVRFPPVVGFLTLALEKFDLRCISRQIRSGKRKISI